MRQRHVFAHRLIGNDNACGMHRNVSRHALKCHGGIDQLAVFIRSSVKLLELGHFERVLQRNAQLSRHGLGDHVHVGIRHAHGSAAITDGGSCRKRTEGDDLRNVILAVAVSHVGDDLIAAIIAKVNINIGHTDTLGIEESLEQQVVADGIHVGNAQCKRDQRACTRASARSYGNAAALGKVHVILHDQEIIGISHLLDDRKLISDTVAVGLLALHGKGDLSTRHAAGKALLGKLVKIGHRVLAVGTREFGQIQRVEIKFHRATVGNADGVFQSTLVL